MWCWMSWLRLVMGKEILNNKLHDWREYTTILIWKNNNYYKRSDCWSHTWTTTLKSQPHQLRLDCTSWESCYNPQTKGHSYVHDIEQWNRSHKLRRFTNSNQVRSESGEWIGSTQESLTIHHCKGEQHDTSCWRSWRDNQQTRYVQPIVRKWCTA